MKRMIQVDNSMNVEESLEHAIKEASRLLQIIRIDNSQKAILPFLEHMRNILFKANEAMSVAIECLDKTKTLDDMSFMKLYDAGASHGAMTAFCRSILNDPSKMVRLAAETGDLILSQMNGSPESIRVILVAKARLDSKS
jgi:hypothetical protein